MSAKKKTSEKPEKAAKSTESSLKKKKKTPQTAASKKEKAPEKKGKAPKAEKKQATAEASKKPAKKADAKKPEKTSEKKTKSPKSAAKKVVKDAKPKAPASKKATETKSKAKPKAKTKAKEPAKTAKKTSASVEKEAYVTGTGLTKNSKAPMFTLPASTGMKISLKEIKGERTVVLFFYPKDDTPGSAEQARDFQKFRDEFTANGSILCGISGDTMESHEEFAEQNGLTFPLLVDKDFKIAKKYGVYGEKTLFGHTFSGITRTTFVIGKNGRMLRIFPNVKIKGHVVKVLEFIKEIHKK